MRFEDCFEGGGEEVETDSEEVGSFVKCRFGENRADVVQRD